MPANHLEDKDIHYACQCIHDLLTLTACRMHCNIWKVLLKRLLLTLPGKRMNLSACSFICKNINMICTAAFAIFHNCSERREAIIDEPENRQPGNACNNFPRSLTARQYHNPYRAIKKFCNYMGVDQWKLFLKRYWKTHSPKSLMIYTCLMIYSPREGEFYN